MKTTAADPIQKEEVSFGIGNKKRVGISRIMLIACSINAEVNSSVFMEESFPNVSFADSNTEAKRVKSIHIDDFYAAKLNGVGYTLTVEKFLSGMMWIGSKA